MSTSTTLNIDDDHRKKIESTTFLFLAAKSGVGKTFIGDYLECARGWKHIDGDIPLKSVNPEYKDMGERLLMRGEYAHIKKEKTLEERYEWKVSEGDPPYMTEIVRLALEGAKDSDKVVLCHATSSAPMRTLVRKLLIDAGAKDVTMIFLDIEHDAHMKTVWKRWQRLAKQADSSVEALFFKYFRIVGVVDFDAFCKAYDAVFGVTHQEPQESEKPYTVVDVTAKDVTVMDTIDKALGIPQDESRGDGLTYDELVEKIIAVDIKRDEEWTC